MSFWSALQFLTIFPSPLRRQVSAEEIGSSLSYFPIVGLILGAILLGLNYGLRFILPPPLVNALLIVALVVLTGANHLDGFIDTCDGAVAGKSAEERLAIMSDTQIGVFGVIGAFLLLLLKYISLNSLASPLRLPALLLMPALSRWTMVWAIFAFPYARRSGLGLAFKQGAQWQRLAVATAVTVAASLVLLKWWGIALIAALSLIIFGFARYLSSRLGGLTGDNYGAINELAEVVVLILLVLLTWRL